jgi:hypothetical protein
VGSAELVARIAAPAARVWEYVRWERMDVYVEAGFFHRVDYDERRAIVGATRSLYVDDGPPVRERIEAIDERAFHYVYRLIDSGPMPVTDYVGQVRITPAGPDACVIKVGCTFSPVGIDDVEWTQIYLDIQDRLFEFIRSRCEPRTPPYGSSASIDRSGA